VVAFSQNNVTACNDLTAVLIISLSVILQGTQADFKNELLFKRFGINYATLPAIFRKGTCIYRKEVRRYCQLVQGMGAVSTPGLACIAASGLGYGGSPRLLLKQFVRKRDAMSVFSCAPEVDSSKAVLHHSGSVMVGVASCKRCS
jgi:hypothetical protein